MGEIWLENWSVVTNNSDPYTPPECRTQHLHGLVFGHPRFKDGLDVTTSEIINIEDGAIRTRSGSLYHLGRVEPAYEKAYPNARKRLIWSLEKLSELEEKEKILDKLEKIKKQL